MKAAFYILLFLFFLESPQLIAQFGFEYAPDLKVMMLGDSLDHAWSGGLNNVQISDFDFDFDGDPDLFIFDRSSDNIRVFTRENGANGPYYQFYYNAAAHFPSDLRYRATLVDYDNDGKKDLFTYAIGGLKVYRNTGNAVNGLQWELFQELIYSEYPNGNSNLYISSTDIPAIVDVDFDGDIDVLTFHIGGQHMEYHQNQSMELYGIPDSLIFELKNECWGKFREDINTSSITLNDQNVPCVGGSIQNPLKNAARHAGSSILAIDYDNSGVLDLILGDVSFPNMNLLINGGTAPNTDSPMISVDGNFPSNTTPVEMQLFPAAFYLDVDFDGVKDLIVGTNARNVSQNENSVLFYKNLGTTANPHFFYVENDFLQHQMIEHGSGSVPVFADLNEDGLEDLIVANFYRYKDILDKESTIAYYQNTGTSTAPVLTFIDEDYLPALTAYGLRSIPTFGDIDGDGDEDMFAGVENGSLAYFENQSTGGNAVFTAGINNYQDHLGQAIGTSVYCFPQLFDLDNDGLLDLIIGKKTGELLFYKNIGTSNVPSFELQNNFLGGVDVSTSMPDGFPSPHFFRQNDTTYLFIGNTDGRLYYYNEIDGHLAQDSAFNLVNDHLLGFEGGRYSAFAVNDLDNDGYLELYAGQDLGGLFRFEVNPESTSSVHENVKDNILVYPNPAEEHIHLSNLPSGKKEICVMDLQGKVIYRTSSHGHKMTIEAQNFIQGLYLIQIFDEHGTMVVKRVSVL